MIVVLATLRHNMERVGYRIDTDRKQKRIDYKMYEHNDNMTRCLDCFVSILNLKQRQDIITMQPYQCYRV